MTDGPPDRRGGTDRDPGADRDAGDAEYVFRVRVQLSPAAPDVRTEPAGVDATLFKRAPLPGEEGWLFFRDNLWRGEVGDHDHLRRLAEETLDVPVRSIEFRELRTDEAYLEALEAGIADDPRAVQRRRRPGGPEQVPGLADPRPRAVSGRLVGSPRTYGAGDRRSGTRHPPESTYSPVA